MKKFFTILFLAVSSNLFAQPCTPNTNSLGFNGTSDFVSFPANTALDLSTALTIEAWVNAAVFANIPDNGTIMCKHGWSNGEGGYVIRAGGNGQVAFNIGGLDSTGAPMSWQQIISPANTIQVGTWAHVAGTFDGDTLKLYVNGQLSGTLLFHGTVASSVNYYLKIGRLADNQPGIYRYWNGLIDEARVWNRALSAQEINDNMNTQIDAALQTGLVGYWRMNEGTGVVVGDLSVNGIAGAYNGSTWSTSVPFSTGAPAATITPSGNTTFCQGNSVNLNASSGTGYTYLWNTGATTQSINVTASGTFTVTVTDQSACSGTSSPVTVTVNPAPATPTITFNGSQLVCSASSGLQWYLNGNTLFNQVNQYYTPLVNGTYTVVVTNGSGCTAVSAPYVLTNLSIHEINDVQHFEVSYHMASQSAIISFETSSSTVTTVSLRDLQGKTISTLLQERIPAGKKNITADCSRLSPGTYLVVISNDTGMGIKKFTVPK